ncbi:uncharacterized protein LOC134624652 [Pelmatolapia mariae]|uniref:uncharacterized protein LOC134624652 n=1 Tax=Pelmatolapia mariae TaxID=158779 RepID=UPI002FE63468
MTDLSTGEVKLTLVVPKPRTGGTADPGLCQQREELVQMVAELAAMQREQAAVCRQRQKELQDQTEYHLQRMKDLAALIRSCPTPQPPPPTALGWRRSILFCRPHRPPRCDQPGRSLSPHPSPLLWREWLVSGRGRLPFLLPRGETRSNCWAHHQLTCLPSPSWRSAWEEPATPSLEVEEVCESPRQPDSSGGDGGATPGCLL